jgi:filamentous hemagglutinin family protein
MAIVGSSVGMMNCAIAQVTPDNTLPNNSSVTRNGNIFNITGGTQTGSNLFHSFGEFSVPTGGTAAFNNPVDIQNIISRVTGGSVSNIDGLIRTSGIANLFLINPNGIIFGQNARLDIGGSFVATTASSLKFSDGREFSATNPQAPPLLTVNVTPGLQYGFQQQGATITNAGNLAAGQDLTLVADNLDLQGQIRAGKNLTLQAQETVWVHDSVTKPFLAQSGGNLTIAGNQGIDIRVLNHPTQTPFVSGGNLSLISNGIISGDAHFASGGSFSIRSASGGLANFVSQYNPIISAAGDVDVAANYTGASLLVEARGNIRFGGDIIITDPNISSLPAGSDGAALSSSLALIMRSGQSSLTYGRANSGSVPASSTGNLPAGITVDGTVNAGAISLSAANGNITTGNLYSQSSSYFGNAGNGGAINLFANGNITTGNLYSRSYSYFGNAGNGGAINLFANGNITTGNLYSRSSSYFGNAGNGGMISLLANGNITTGDLYSWSYTNSGNAANGGVISIESAKGSINTGKLDSSSESIASTAGNSEDGGAISLSAPNGSIIIGDLYSYSSSKSGTAGNGGAITLNADGDITTKETRIEDDASLDSVSTLNSSSKSESGTAGDGGAITLTAGDNITIETLNSSSASESGTAGNGGAITLTAGDNITTRETRIKNSLSFNSVSTLNSSSESESGDARNGGAITLNAGGDILNINSIFRSSSSSSFGSGDAGDGGAITLNAGGDIVDNGNLGGSVLISSSNSSSGNAGDGGAITLNAGGRISTFSTFTLYFSGILDSSSGCFYSGSCNAGDGGAITLNASGDISTASLNSSSVSGSGNVGNGGAITLNTGGDIIIDSGLGGLNSSSVSLEGSTGDGGAISLFAKNGDITGTEISSFSFSGGLNGGKGGNITLEAKNNILNAEILTESSNSLSGTVQLNGFENLEITNTKIITSRQFSIGGASGTGAAVSWDVDLNDKGQSGNVNITSKGNLTLNNSSIESDTKGSNPAGNVNITSPGLITFNNSKIVSNSSSTGTAGSIILSADQGITFADSNSGLFAQASDEGKAGSITINTPELTLQQNAEISTSTTGIGKAGDISLNTDILNLASGGKVLAFTTGSGNGGTITVNAPKEVNLGIGVQDFAPILSVETSGAGKAGNIFVSTPNLTLSDTARITATATATATNTESGGSITLNASKMDLAGIVGVFAETQGESPAGTLTLQPDNNKPTLDLTLAPGSKISASTSGSGKGGDLLVNAPQAINISGQGKLAVETTGTGNAGNIEISTQKLTLSDGVQISASTDSSGKAGNITLTVTENITLAGTGTGLFASTSENSTGESGNIIIDPRIMTIRDGAKIAVDSQGENIGGDIELVAGFLTLDKGTISAQTRSNTGGNITLFLQDLLLLRNGSQITSTAGNQEFGGDGGNITINVPSGFIIAFPNENSDITANAFRGSGGKITINATNIFGITALSRQELNKLRPDDLDPNQLLTNDITAISQTSPNLSGTIDLITPEIDPNSGLVELPTAPVNTADLLDSGCSAFNNETGSQFTISGRGGLPPNPNDSLTGDYLWSDTRFTTAAKPQNRSGDRANKAINLTDTASIIPASSWVFNDEGEVTLVSHVAQENVDSPNSNQPTCLKSE